jgi:superoxide dismutase
MGLIAISVSGSGFEAMSVEKQERLILVNSIAKGLTIVFIKVLLTLNVFFLLL